MWATKDFIHGLFNIREKGIIIATLRYPAKKTFLFAVSRYMYNVDIS